MPKDFSKIYVDVSGVTRYHGTDAEYVKQCRRLAALWQLCVEYDHIPAAHDIMLTASLLGHFVTTHSLKADIQKLKGMADLMALAIEEN